MIDTKFKQVKSPFKLPLSYLLACPLNKWSEIKIGVEEGWISKEDLPVLMEKMLLMCSSNIIFPQSENFVDFINLKTMEEDTDIKDIQKKWAYCLLNWLYQNRSEFSEPFEVVSYIYSSLGYLEDIEGLVPYMPLPESDPSLNLNETYEDRMLKKWGSFLNTMAEKYGPISSV